MALYRFKSRETGDLVMLGRDGKRILEVLGKDPSGPGIIQPSEMEAAVQALRDAAKAEEEERQRLVEEAQAKGEVPPDFDIALRVRAAPFIEMLERCRKADVEVVWGV
jgi:hypothetical protein